MLFSRPALVSRLRRPLSAGARLWTDVSGATAIEYGLMVAMVALAIVVAVFHIGDDVANMYNEMNSEVEDLAATR